MPEQKMGPTARDAESPEAESKRLEKARSDAKFGIAFTEQLDTLDEMIEGFAEQVKDNPEMASALKLAEKRKELFLAEHDQAGAFKFKRLGREMQGYFEDAPDREKVIEVDPEGKLQVSESAKDRRLMFVNMGELDRFNKEGGSHSAGDEALKETARAIERVVREKLQDKETTYTLLRYSGNEFAVSFDKISEDDLKIVMAAVERERPTVGDLDPAPLVAEGFDFNETLDIVNQLQAELGEDERLDPSDPMAATREIMEVMRRRANYALDAKKFRSRIGRVQEVVSQKGEEEAQKFFDNYMAKLFKNTELPTLDSFKDVDRKDAERMSFEFASKMLGQSRSVEDAKRAIIDSRIREIREQRAGGEPESAHVAPEGVTLGPDAGPETGLVRPKLAEVPELTEGQRILQQKAELAKKAKEEAEKADDPFAAATAELEYDVEAARRDKGTGLLERGVHYESLEKAFKDGKEVSMAFVDMGFLKYFDNKGGPDVGDAGLKMAASVIEKAIVEAGVDATAYRYGGDEFTVQIAGGPEALKQFSKALENQRKAAGAIPAGKRGNRDGYYPAELVFNMGGADTKTADEIFEDLKSSGKYGEEELSDPGRVANIKAEIMTLLADKGVESSKAVDRFLLLADMLRGPGYHTLDGKPDGPPTERKTQVDAMISFSNKAIFAEKGGGEFLKLLAASGKDALTMRAEVVQWVEAAMKEKESKEGKKRELLDQLVEMHTKIAYYQRELDRLETKNETQAAEITRLKTEKAQVEKDRDALVGVRKTLDSLDEAA